MKSIQSFLCNESWSPNYADQMEVEGVIETFTQQEKKWTGSRNFFNSSEFRRVEWKNNKPICFVEARLYNRSAKLNIGCVKEYRDKDYMQNLLRICIEEIKKMGIKYFIYEINKNDLVNINIAFEMGFKEIKDDIIKTRMNISEKNTKLFFMSV